MRKEKLLKEEFVSLVLMKRSIEVFEMLIDKIRNRFSSFSFRYLLTGCMLTAALFLLSASSSNSTRQASEDTNLTFDQLLSMSPQELENIDIALMNLICAKDLNGAENLDIKACLKTLDKWAEIVEKDTKARLPNYHNNPANYDNSINLFKIVNMVLCLKDQIGMDYNQKIMQSTDFSNSRDFFIHGCITGKKEGGCISIPLTCVAVGRRLGYPLKLVTTRQHIFFRWDDGKEVFNMEACCPGCDSHPDKYYMNWPFKITKADVKLNNYLKSLTSAEELAICLQTRGHCLYDNGKVTEAQLMYAYAYKLMPDSLDMLAGIQETFNHEIKKFQEIDRQIKSKDPK